MNNAIKRVVSGLIFGVLLIFGLIWDRTIFSALFVTILLLCLKEFYRLTVGERFRLMRILSQMCAATAFICVCGYCFFDWSLKYVILLLIPLLLIPAAALIETDKESISDASPIYLGLLYIALPICLSPFMMMDGEVFDGWTMLSLFILLWASDIGAYALGTLFGQKPNSRKLAPNISPQKSFWGFWSGIGFSVAASVGLHFLTWLPFSIINCVVLAVIVSIMGVVGDLFESLWKRRYGVKDSGNIIPGHGGLLDRFDSSLVALPAAAVYMSLAGLL